MRPYYEKDGIIIYHGDARDVLPLACDLIVTDPPFYLPARISASRKEWPRSLGDLGVMFHYFNETFKACRASLNPGGAFYTFCDSTSYAVFLSAAYPLFARTQSIIWAKGRGGLGNGWRHAHEIVLHGALSDTNYTPGFRIDVLTAPVVPSVERSHPSEKPAAILDHLIGAHPEGALVLDPFMGTGSTLIAARRLGRRAVGVELDERFCQIAAERLSA